MSDLYDAIMCHFGMKNILCTMYGKENTLYRINIDNTYEIKEVK